VLSPTAPVGAWLDELDALSARSAGFFNGRAIVLDLAAIPPDRAVVEGLVKALAERGIRVMAVEGAGSHELGLGLPPAVGGGRDVGPIEAPTRAHAKAEPAPAQAIAAPQVRPSLFVDEPVRSGQSIVFPEGDVTILGSIGSGAEVLAGGSIHVYGALRGRAMAGMTGNPQARILCRRLDAELIAIDGLYLTADNIDDTLRGRPVQAWLEGERMAVTPLD
jgi:septum site-determining protein MinC